LLPSGAVCVCGHQASADRRAHPSRTSALRLYPVLHTVFPRREGKARSSASLSSHFIARHGSHQRDPSSIPVHINNCDVADKFSLSELDLEYFSFGSFSNKRSLRRKPSLARPTTSVFVCAHAVSNRRTNTVLCSYSCTNEHESPVANCITSTADSRRPSLAVQPSTKSVKHKNDSPRNNDVHERVCARCRSRKKSTNGSLSTRHGGSLMELKIQTNVV